MTQPFADALMWVPKSRALAATLAQAHDFARARSHADVTLEHLLQALLEDPDAVPVLQACGIDLDALGADVAAHVKALATSDQTMPGVDPQLSRILEYAVAAAQQSRRREVTGAIVLAAIVGEGKSSAAGLLQTRGLTFEETVRALARTGGVPSGGPKSASGTASAPTLTPALTPATVGSRTAEIDVGSTTAIRSEPDKPSIRPEADKLGRAPVEDPITAARRRIQAAKAAAAAPPVKPVVPDVPGDSDAPTKARVPTAAPPSLPLALDGAVDANSMVVAASAARGPGTRRRGPVDGRAPALALPSAIDFPRTGTGGLSLDVPSLDVLGPVAVPAKPFDATSLVANLPRRWLVDRPVTVEIRVPRVALGSIDSRRASRSGRAVGLALSVRLKSTDRRVSVEPGGAETLWLLHDGADAGIDEDPVWRWTVTPRRRGRTRLHLGVTWRPDAAGDEEGVDTALPEQVVPIRVRGRWLRSVGRLVAIIAAAASGAAVSRWVDDALVREAFSALAVLTKL